MSQREYLRQTTNSIMCKMTFTVNYYLNPRAIFSLLPCAIVYPVSCAVLPQYYLSITSVLHSVSINVTYHLHFILFIFCSLTYTVSIVVVHVIMPVYGSGCWMLCCMLEHKSASRLGASNQSRLQSSTFIPAQRHRNETRL